LKNKRILYIIVLVSPLAAAALSLFTGAYALPPLKVVEVLISAFSHSEYPGMLSESAVLFDIRLPRILLAGIVGASLSLSGTTLQGIFRNPLVDPSILGISAGSAFGCALCIGFFPAVPVQVASLAFGVAAVVMAYLVAAAGGRMTGLSLVLSGVIVSAFFSALVSIIKFIVDPYRLQSIVFWLMGSFALADWRGVMIAAAGVGMPAVPLCMMRWRLNVLSMGDDEARSLGVDVRRDRVIFIALSTIAVSVGVSLSGIIGWIGLIVPHLLRMMIGPDHRPLVSLSIAGGAAFMIIADTIARNVSSYDIPIGVVTALLGAPFFMCLMTRGARSFEG
jgi:iron complex transport system permease protein